MKTFGGILGNELVVKCKYCSRTLLHIQDKLTRNAFHILTQEIMCRLIYLWTNLPPSAREVANLQRLQAHLDLTLLRLCFDFQYIALGEYAVAVSILQALYDINLF
jgi:hypothetical protein